MRLPIAFRDNQQISLADSTFSDVTLILSCLTDVTFVEQSMRYAT